MGIKIVIADEPRIGREGLRALFTAQPEMEIVGEADTGDAVVRIAQDVCPDVVLFGLDMPGLGGIDATRKMVGFRPTVRIIGIAEAIDAQLVRELLAAGGAGFITKCNSFSDFLTAVRAVMAKRTYLSPDVAQAMVDQYILRPPADLAYPAAGALTHREREVLHLVAEGMSTKEVALELKISTKTVDMHRQRLMAKLKIHSVAELTKYAIREGITALHS